MANLGHLAILRDGVKNWNDWREDNPKIEPNLKGANLKGANLKGANLKNVNLEEVIAGIQYHWLILILISSSILSFISGLTWAYMSFLLLLTREDGFSPTVISGIVTMICFYVFTISEGLLKGISSLIG
ncbi:MAG: pentapeptide repeat-containing protein, partial [Cyanobacteria bacterium J06633_1]